MGKKIWLSMHPGNFGNDVTVRMPVRITGITHSTGNVMQGFFGHTDFLETKTTTKSSPTKKSVQKWTTEKQPKRQIKNK